MTRDQLDSLKYITKNKGICGGHFCLSNCYFTVACANELNLNNFPNWECQIKERHKKCLAVTEEDLFEVLL